MKRVSSNARWAALTPKQRKTLESWLFEEKLGYDEALKRARVELGYAGSRTSLQRFCERLTHERWMNRLAESGRAAAEVAQAPVRTGTFMGSGMKILGQQFWEQIQTGPEELKDVPMLAKLLLQSEENQIQRDENLIRREAVELRRRALDMQEKRWQFDIVEEATKRLPELQELQQAKDDEKDPYAHNKRMNKLITRMFGESPEPLPESPEDEVRLAELKARRAEARQREHEEWLARKNQPPEPRPARPRAEREGEEAKPEPPWEDKAEENPFPFNDPAKVAKLGFQPGGQME